MKRGNTFSQVFKNGCVIFTIITLIIYGIGTLLSNADKAFIPTFQWILLFFVFSLFFSCTNQILRLDRFSFSLRILLHFLTAATLYVIAVILCGGLYKNGVVLLLSILLFIAGYILFAVLYSFRMRRTKGTSNEKDTYKPVFH